MVTRISGDYWAQVFSLRSVRSTVGATGHWSKPCVSFCGRQRRVFVFHMSLPSNWENDVFLFFSYTCVKNEFVWTFSLVESISSCVRSSRARSASLMEEEKNGKGV